MEDLVEDDGRFKFRVRHEGGFSLDVHLSLRGRHQVENARGAVAAARELSDCGFPISDVSIQQGLASARWPGRLEVLRKNPLTFLDGAHNPAGARALLRFWEENFRSRRIVPGLWRDARQGCCGNGGDTVSPAAAVVLTKPRQARAADPETVRELTGHLNSHLYIEANPDDALEAAVELAGTEGIIFIAGSLFLIADFKRNTSRAAQAKVTASAPR